MHQTLLGRVKELVHNHPLGVAALVAFALIGAMATLVNSMRTVRSAVAGLTVESVRVADDPTEVAGYARWIPVDTGAVFVKLDAVQEKYPGGLPAQRWVDSAMSLMGASHGDTVHLGALLDSVIVSSRVLPATFPPEALRRGVGLVPIVDVVLRNVDSKPALITELEYAAVLLKGTKSETACVAVGPMPVSSEYHLLLSGTRTQRGQAELTHEVPPNSLDRIALKIATNDDLQEALFRLRIRLTYNRGRQLVLPPVDVRLTWACMRKHEAGLRRPLKLPPD